MEVKIEEGPRLWGGIYSKIELAMKVNGVDCLGDKNYREKHMDRFGVTYVLREEKNKAPEVVTEMRYASLDMDDTGRILRTLIIRRLNNDQIDKLHRAEVKKGLFILDSGQVKNLLKIDFKSEILNDERIGFIRAFNNSHRPEMRMMYGVRVPAYFPPDYEFDGMEYHHEWDKNVSFGDLVLPEVGGKGKKTAQGLLI